MRTDIRIIKYIENDMTSEERSSFENDLKNSSELKEEFEKYLQLQSAIKDSKDVKLNQNYFNSVITEFRNKNINLKTKTVQRNFGYAFGVLLIAILSTLITKNLFYEKKDVNDINEFAESLNENQKIELLQHLNSDIEEYNLISVDEVDSQLTNLLQAELGMNHEIVETYDISYTEMVDDLNPIEAEKIYEELLNKNFSEEVEL